MCGGFGGLGNPGMTKEFGKSWGHFFNFFDWVRVAFVFVGQTRRIRCVRGIDPKTAAWSFVVFLRPKCSENEITLQNCVFEHFRGALG